METAKNKVADFWINGSLCAPCTPFTKTGDVNTALIDPYIQHLVDYGVLNVFLTGTTGEGNSMTVAERKQVVEAWVLAARNRLSTIIVHVGAGNLLDSQELAKHAQEIGAAAISCVSPTYHKPETLESYIAYMKAVADCAPHLPFYLYDIDFITGLHFSMVDFFEAGLKQIPTLRGVKHTSPSFPSMHMLVARFGKQIQVLSGNDEVYLEGLSIGIAENIGHSFLGKVVARIKLAFDRGDLETARKEQIRALEACYVRRKYDINFPTFAKIMLTLHGLDVGQPRLPLVPYSDTLLQAVKADLNRIGYFDWSV